LLTLAARGQGHEAFTHLAPANKASRVVAVTGSGGVGKSTLVGKLIQHVRKLGLTVAVLACDPQSPVSGGALLGDRFRMPSLPDDDGVFIRSVAAASGLGGISDHLDAMVHLLEAFGFDVVLIETVGAGQGDTAVRSVADIFVLLLQPETGDDLQWEKAGVLEVADVVGIHKEQVRASLNISGGAEIPILKVSAKTGAGIDQLWQVIDALPQKRDALDHDVRDLLSHAQAELKRRFTRGSQGNEARLCKVIEDWRLGRIDDQSAGAAVLSLLGGSKE